MKEIIEKLEFGDILLVHSGSSFLAHGITEFMKMYLKRKGIDPKSLPFIPHHAATIVDVWGKKYVAEAIKEGYVVRPLLKAYTEEEWYSRVKILTPITPYTREQQKLISEKAIIYSLDGTPYDVWNFVYQMIMIGTTTKLFGKGLWFGPKGEKAEAKFYCSEVAANLAHDIDPKVFPHPESINPVDIYLSPYFSIKQ